MGTLHDLIKNPKVTDKEILAKIYSDYLKPDTDIDWKNLVNIWSPECLSLPIIREPLLQLAIRQKRSALIKPLLEIAKFLDRTIEEFGKGDKSHLIDTIFGTVHIRVDRNEFFGREIYAIAHDMSRRAITFTSSTPEGHPTSETYLCTAIDQLDEKQAAELLHETLQDRELPIVDILNYIHPRDATSTPETQKGILGFVLSKKYLNVLEILINQHPLFNINKQQPFYWAITENNKEGLERLLLLDKDKIDVNQIDMDNLTPLMRAIQSKNQAFALALIKHERVNVNVQDPFFGKTALHFVLEQTPLNLELLNLLIQRGADLQIQDKLQTRPVDLMVKNKEAQEILKKLDALKHELVPGHKAYTKRLNKIQIVRMDAQLFAHINNGYKIKGTKLEGNVFFNTAAFMAEYLKLISEGNVIKLQKEEAAQLNELSEKFVRFCDRSYRIGRYIMDGLKKLEDLKKEAYKPKTGTYIGSGGSAGALSSTGLLTQAQALIKLNEDTKKLENTMLGDTAKDLMETVVEELKINKSALMPGGWHGSPGHAMVYEFKYDPVGNLIFTIYNSGDGIHYHQMKNLKKKIKHSATLNYRIPKELINNYLPEIMKNLLRPQMLGLWDSLTKYDAERTYNEIIKTLSKEGITLLSTDQKSPYMRGQRSGTCSWNALTALLKTKLSKNLYLDVKLQGKFQSLLEYVPKLSEADLESFDIRQSLKDAISNLNRLIQKRVKSGQDIKFYADIIDYCEAVTRKLEAEETAKRRLTTHPSIAELLEFQPKDLYLLNPKRSPDFNPELEKVKKKQEALYNYDLNFKFTDPKTDLDSMLKKIELLKNNHQASIYIEKAIEQFLMHIPLGSSKEAKGYWDTVGPESVLTSFCALMNVQKIYYDVIAEGNNHLSHASRLTSAYHLLAMQKLLMNQRFKPGSAINFQDNIQAEIDRLESDIFSNPQFILDNPSLKTRITEIQKVLKREDGTSKSKNKLSLSNILIQNKVDYSKLEPYLRKKIDEINAVRRKHNPDAELISLSNEQEYALYLAATENQEAKLLDEATKTDYQLYLASLLANADNKLLSKADYTVIKNQNPYNIDRLFYLETGKLDYYTPPLRHLSTNEPFDSNSVEFKLSPGIPEPLPHKELDDLVLQATQKHMPTSLKRFKIDPQQKSSNPIQIYIKDNYQYTVQLNDRVANNRLLRHSYGHVVKTLDTFSGQLDKLKEIDYQNILEYGLFGKGSLKEELERNPGVVVPMIQFFSDGIKYYSENEETFGPVYFFLKLNAYLLSYLQTLSESHPARQQGYALAAELDKTIEKFLIKNDPEKRSFASVKAREEAIIVQKHLYFNLLQRVQRECLQNNVSLETLKNYLKSVFYNSLQDITPEDPEARFDPIYKNIKADLLYRITPSLMNHLKALSQNKKGTEAIIEFIVECLPKSLQDEFSIIQKEALDVQFHFPKLDFTLKSGGIVTIDLVEGAIQRMGFKDGPLPSWVYEDENYQSLFKGKIREGSVRGDKKAVVFLNGQYRLEQNKKLFRNITIEGESQWYEIKPFEEDEDLLDLPRFLNDKTFQAWVRKDGSGKTQSIVYSDVESGKILYYLKEGKIYNTEGYEQVKLFNVLKSAPSTTPFDFLKRFEGEGFLEVLKKTPQNMNKEQSELILRAPRYDLEFKIKKDKPDSVLKLLWTQDTRYQLDCNNSETIIPGFTGYLRLKPIEVSVTPEIPQVKTNIKVNKEGEVNVQFSLDDESIGLDTKVTSDLKAKKDTKKISKKEELRDMILIPYLPFIADDQKKTLILDKEGHYLGNIMESTFKQGTFLHNYIKSKHGSLRSFMPQSWYLKGSLHVIKCYQDKDGNLDPENTEDCLYLAYLYLGANHPEKAFDMLETFKKRGGFSGSHLEAKTIYWLLKEIPFPLGDPKFSEFLEPKVVANQKDAVISTPELWAFRAQLLSMVTKHLDAQKSFELEDKIGQVKNPRVAEKEGKELNNFFTRDNLAQVSMKILREYGSTERNIPTRMELRPEEQYHLFQQPRLHLKDKKLLSEFEYDVSLQNRYKQLEKHHERSLEKAFAKPSNTPLRGGNQSKQNIIQSKFKIAYPKENLRYTPYSSMRGMNDPIVLGYEDRKKGKTQLAADDLNIMVKNEDFWSSYVTLLEYALGEPIGAKHYSKFDPDRIEENRNKVLEFAKQKIQGYFQSKIQLNKLSGANTQKMIEELYKNSPYLYNHNNGTYSPDTEYQAEKRVLYFTCLLYHVAKNPLFFSTKNFKDNEGIQKDQFFIKDHRRDKGFIINDAFVKKGMEIQEKLGGHVIELDLPTFETINLFKDKKELDELKTPKTKKSDILHVDDKIKQETSTFSKILRESGLSPDLKEPLDKTAKSSEDSKDIKDIKEQAAIKPLYEGMNVEDYQEGIKQNRNIQLFYEAFLKKASMPNTLSNLRSKLDSELQQTKKTIEEHFEKQLLEFANKLPQSEGDQLFLRTERMGSSKIKFNLRDVLKLYLLGDKNEYNQLSPHLSSDDINHLYNLTTQYLLEATQYKQMLRADKALKDLEESEPGSDDYEKNSAKLAEILYEKRVFDYRKEPALLAFEYFADITIREAQKNIITKLIGEAVRDPLLRDFKSAALQLIMGGGKTKVLIPISSYEKAKGNNLVVVLVPPALYATNFKDLASSSKTLLNQEAVPFSFNRNTDCNINNLKSLKELLLSTLVNKNYLVTTGNDVKSLELKYLELLNQENSDPAAITLLEEMLDIFESRADVLMDEVDTVLDIRKELNFTISQLGKEGKNIEPLIAEQLVNFYFDIQDVTFRLPSKDKKLEKEYSVRDILNSKLPTLSEEGWKNLYSETIAPAIIEYLFKTKESPILAIAHQYKIDETILKNYLLGKANEIPVGVKAIPNTAAGKNAKEIIGLYKGQLTELLKLTLNRQADVNYGKSKLKTRAPVERELAIPYEGNGAPSENSKFSSYLEEANYTIQYHLLKGISLDVFKRMIKEFRDSAIKEKMASPGLYKTISDTPTGLKFKTLTGITENLRAINDNDDAYLKTKMEEINQRPKERDVFIRFCLKNYIVGNIKIYNKILRHTALNHTSMYRSVQGVSGTILSPFIFDERMEFHEEIAKGTDGKTLDHLIRKNTKIVKAKPGPVLDRLKAQLLADPQYRAFIDVGSHCKGISNLKVAEEIAAVYREGTWGSQGRPPMQYVLFFNEKNALCAINIHKPDIIIEIGKTDPNVIKARLQCEPSDCFTYYDERRTTGTDIKQMPQAKALVSFSAHTIQRDLLQGSMRMRDLAGTHQVSILVSPELIAAYPERAWSLLDVLELAQKNQNYRIKDDNFRAAVQKMKNTIRRNLLKKIKTAKTIDEKKSLLSKFSKVIFSVEEDSTFNLFKDIEAEDATVKVLENFEKNLLETWENCIAALFPTKKSLSEAQRTDIEASLKIFLAEKETIQKELKAIIKMAIPLCNPRTKVQKEGQNTEVTAISDKTTKLEAEKKQEKEQEAKKERETETQINLFRASAEPRVNEPSLKFHKLNRVLSQVLIDDKLKKSRPFDFSQNLLVSEDFYKTEKNTPVSFFDTYQKPIFYILFMYNKQTKSLDAILLSPDEAELFRLKQNAEIKIKKMADFHYVGSAGALKTKQTPEDLGLTDEEKACLENPCWKNTEFSDPNIQYWITTPKEIPFFGTPPRKEIFDSLRPEYDLLLEQIQFLNGDTDLLMTNAKNVKWLNMPDKNIKLAFYKQFVLATHPNKASNYALLRNALMSEKDRGMDLVKEKQENVDKMGMPLPAASTSTRITTHPEAQPLTPSFYIGSAGSLKEETEDPKSSPTPTPTDSAEALDVKGFVPGFKTESRGKSKKEMEERSKGPDNTSNKKEGPD